MGRDTPDLPQGTLDMLVLKALSLGSMHGYGIGQRIQQLADNMLRVEEGTCIRRFIASNDTAGSRASGACRTTTGAHAFMR
jgi:hypothetical protein